MPPISHLPDTSILEKLKARRPDLVDAVFKTMQAVGDEHRKIRNEDNARTLKKLRWRFLLEGMTSVFSFHAKPQYNELLRQEFPDYYLPPAQASSHSWWLTGHAIRCGILVVMDNNRLLPMHLGLTKAEQDDLNACTNPAFYGTPAMARIRRQLAPVPLPELAVKNA